MNYMVHVRGKSIFCGRGAINSYFNLPNITDDRYLKWGREHYDLENVIRRLGKLGTNWTLKQNTTEKVSRYKKAWYNFICANLMPTRPQNDVTKEQAHLLFAIVTNKPVDVGLTIKGLIIKYLRGSTTDGLPHTSLVTRLCR